MIKEYLVPKPSDFRILIDDILEFHKKSKKETLVLTLEGDLGAGKTTFTQELAKKLRVEEVVTSPTFTIMKQYEVSTLGFEELIHIDAYRIESEEELRPLHLDNMLKKPHSIICIEWPEKIKNIIPDDAINISIKMKKGEERSLTVSTS